MAANVVVDLGPARSGKTNCLLGLYRAALGRSAFGRQLWIAPTSRSAADVRERLVVGGIAACLSPGVTTFDELTASIVAVRLEPLSPVSACARRELVRCVVGRSAERGRLKCFAATAHSAGFVDLVVEHIRELKRREIEPAAFAKAPSRRPTAAEHEELAQLYSDYQQLLSEHGLADREGAHWLARDQLAAGQCASLSELEFVVVDGFTDLTPTQHDVLRLLAVRAKQLHIALPADAAEAGDWRADLFAKTTSTLAELRRHHPQLEIRRHPPQKAAWPALGHLAENLFRDPRQAPPLPAAARGSLERFEFVAAAGQHGEIVEIARRIKRRLASGQARPGDVVVVFHGLHQAAPRVREVFEEFGIPLALETSERLVQSPPIRALVGLLRMAVEDWPFRRVVAALTNNLLTSLGDASRQAADWLVRDLQIAGGRDALFERVGQLATAPNRGDSLSEHQERRAAAARQALPAIRKLVEALGELPDVATLAAWCEALAMLAGRLGLEALRELNASGSTDHLSDQSIDTANSTKGADKTDRRAWQSLVGHLNTLRRLDDRLGEGPRTLTRQELLYVLVDVATHERLPGPRDETGRVRVLSAATARTVAVKHLFLAGLSEQAFPSPEPAGRLYTEDDYRFLQRVAGPHALQSSDGAASSPLPNRSQEEMLLFYEVLTRAEESLTLSYPALDEKAQALPPSPYLIEIERLFGAENFASRQSSLQPSPLPRREQGEMPLSPVDWRLLAVDQALSRDCKLLAGVFSDKRGLAPGAAIDAGLRITEARGHRDTFGPADGLLVSMTVAERLSRRFGSQHYWSPSQWEQYAACPFKFYLTDVLGLEPLGDLTLETDFGRRGGLLHHVLATFHRAGNALAGGSSNDEAEFLARLLGVLQETVAATPRSGVDAALVELDRRQIAKWAAKHFEHLSDYASATGGDKTLAPTHFELRFGPVRPGSGDDDPHSKDAPFELDIGSEKVRVTGRIDRIDVGRVDGQDVFSVIDYKTGRTTSLKEEQITSGERLQLPIYVAAAQALLFNNEATPIAAGYWTMNGGFDQRGALKVLQEQAGDAEGVDKWRELQQQVTDRVTQFVRDIRHGDFPVHSRDEHCTGRCEFSTVCRVAQVRALGKAWPASDE